MFEHSPNEKGMVYGPNGKRIMTSKEYTLIIYNPNEKGMVLWNIVFPRCTIKYTMSIKISAMQLQELHSVNKSKVTSSFQGVCIVCIFGSFFLFTISVNW